MKKKGQNSMAKIVIKKGNMELISMDKMNVIEVKHTGDGLVLVLKEGIFITYQDAYLPSSVKDIIVHMCMSTKNDTSVTVDLANYRQPVSVSTQ